MRRPSTYGELYAWWRRACADPRTPVYDGIPEAGFFRCREVKGGPWVPVRIFVVREIDEAGELAAPEELWAQKIDDAPIPAERVWGRVKPITRQAYDDLLTAHRAAGSIMRATHAPVDLSREPARPR